MNRKFFSLMIVLFALTPAFSCFTNSVEVIVNNTAIPVQVYHLFEAKYNVYENNSLYFYAHNDSSMNIKMDGERIVFQSLNESTDWNTILEEELYYLRGVGALNLTDEEIIFISSQGCCGVYKEGEFSAPRGCDETFTVPVVNTKLTWIAVLLSVLPGAILIVYLSKTDLNKYLIAVLGGIAWTIAYFLRKPLLVQAASLELLSNIIISSLLAAVFEESIRYIIMKCSDWIKKKKGIFGIENSFSLPLILGLGWGVTEALIIFVVYLSYLLLMNQPITFMAALPGAVERISVIFFHTALTMIVYYSLKNKIHLLTAMFLHFFMNTISVISAKVYYVDVWLIELFIIIVTIITGFIAYSLNKKGQKNVKKNKRTNKKRTRKRR